tara:strand:+ start:348 stop:503 length:156 start_codon:yes stop_codon:yes gene_type:complete
MIHTAYREALRKALSTHFGKIKPLKLRLTELLQRLLRSTGAGIDLMVIKNG